MTEKEINQIKIDLLVWAGVHRGKGISEEAMPRFHEIIDKIEVLDPEHEKVGREEVQNTVENG